MEDAFIRSRRNLNIMSVALITYVVAGGSLDGAMFGIVNVENTKFIEAGAWLIWLYFFYRFELYAYKAKDRWHLQRLWYMRDALPGVTTKEMGNHLAYLDIRRHWTKRVATTARSWTNSDFEEWMESAGTQWQAREGSPQDKDIDWKDYIRPATYAYVQAFRLQDGWSEYMVPRLLAGAAYLLGLTDLVMRIRSR